MKKGRSRKMPLKTILIFILSNISGKVLPITLTREEAGKILEVLHSRIMGKHKKRVKRGANQ